MCRQSCRRFEKDGAGNRDAEPHRGGYHVGLIGGALDRAHIGAWHSASWLKSAPMTRYQHHRYIGNRDNDVYVMCVNQVGDRCNEPWLIVGRIRIRSAGGAKP